MAQKTRTYHRFLRSCCLCPLSCEQQIICYLYSMKNVSFQQWMVLVIATLLFSACKYSEEPTVYKGKDVEIAYPSYLSEAEGVYPMKNALVQAKNDYRDVYFILVDHGMKPGDNGFELMFDSITTQLKRNLREVKIETPDTMFVTANQLKVKEARFSGILSSEKQDHRFLFLIDVFETSEGHIYQTAGWLFRHKQHLWLEDLKTAAYSLKKSSPPAEQ